LAAKTARDEKTDRELAPTGETPVAETSEGLEKSSLPEEDASGRPSYCIHAIRWRNGLGRLGGTQRKPCETWVVTEASEARRSIASYREEECRVR